MGGRCLREGERFEGVMRGEEWCRMVDFVHGRVESKRVFLMSVAGVIYPFNAYVL